MTPASGLRRAINRVYARLYDAIDELESLRPVIAAAARGTGDRRLLAMLYIVSATLDLLKEAAAVLGEAVDEHKLSRVASDEDVVREAELIAREVLGS